MPWIACPQCTHTFRSAPYAVQTCPACGFQAPTDRNKPTPTEGVQEGDRTIAVVPELTGKVRRFLGYCFLSIFTLGLYSLLWFGKVFSELHRQHGQKPRNGLYGVHVAFALLCYVFLGLEVFLILSDYTVSHNGLYMQVAFGAALPLGATGLWIAFLALEIPRLQRYRRAHGLRSGIGVWGFILLGLPLVIAIAGVTASFDPELRKEMGSQNADYLRLAGIGVLPYIIGIGLLSRSIQQLWLRILDERNVPVPEWAQRARARAAERGIQG